MKKLFDLGNADPNATLHMAVLTGKGPLTIGKLAKVAFVNAYDHQQANSCPEWKTKEGALTAFRVDPNGLGQCGIELDGQRFYIPKLRERTDIRYGYAYVVTSGKAVEALCLACSGKEVTAEYVVSKGVVKNLKNMGPGLVQVSTDKGEKFVLEVPAGCNIGIPVTCQ